MQVSAELRWFWPAQAPEGLEDWFCKSSTSYVAAGGGDEGRADIYLMEPSQEEVGIKRRGGKPGIEIKGLVAEIDEPVSTKTFDGRIQLWTKWSLGSDNFSLTRTIEVHKLRWLRKFDTSSRPPTEIPLDGAGIPIDDGRLPEQGCNVELTKVWLSDQRVWWTFGFEAFGRLHSVEDSIRSTVQVMQDRKPTVAMGDLASYPRWLSQI